MDFVRLERGIISIDIVECLQCTRRRRGKNESKLLDSEVERVLLAGRKTCILECH